MSLTFGLIDKNVVVRLGIGIVINKNLDVQILESNDPTIFGMLYTNTRFDIIILGNSGSVSESVLTIQKLREGFRNVPIIVFDENETSNLILRYLENGVNGCLRKETLHEDLLPCINEVLHGKGYLSPDILQNLLTSLNKRKGKRSKDILPHLTARESQIAELLCAGMRTTLIANTLGRKSSTISTIKNTIFRKMNVQNIVDLSKMLGTEHQL